MEEYKGARRKDDKYGYLGLIRDDTDLSREMALLAATVLRADQRIGVPSWERKEQVHKADFGQLLQAGEGETGRGGEETIGCKNEKLKQGGGKKKRD